MYQVHSKIKMTNFCLESNCIVYNAFFSAESNCKDFIQCMQMLTQVFNVHEVVLIMYISMLIKILSMEQYEKPTAIVSLQNCT